MSKWQPIETAPKDKTPILVYTGDGSINSHGGKYVVGFYAGRSHTHGDDYEYCTSSDNVGYIVQATHWMPLPEPPK